MIAAVMDPDEPSKKPCVVYWTGRKGLSVKTKTWCGAVRDASDGVIQIPEDTALCETCTSYIKKGRPNL